MTTFDKRDSDAVPRTRAESLLADAKEDRTNIEQKELDEIFELLNNDDHHVRRYAARTLGEISYGDSPYIEHLLEETSEALDDEDRFVRLHSADALAHLGETNPDGVVSAVPTLLSIAHDKMTHRWIRESILRSLTVVAGERPDAFESEIETLVECLDDPQDSVPREAAEILAAVTMEENLQMIDEILDHDNPKVREGAADMLAQRTANQPEAVTKRFPLVQTLLTDDSPYVRKYALQALGEAAKQYPDLVSEAKQDVFEILENDVHFVRKEAFEAFVHIGSESDLEAIRKYATTTNEDIYSVAEDCIQQIEGSLDGR